MIALTAVAPYGHGDATQFSLGNPCILATNNPYLPFIWIPKKVVLCYFHLTIQNVRLSQCTTVVWRFLQVFFPRSRNRDWRSGYMASDSLAVRYFRAVYINKSA